MRVYYKCTLYEDIEGDSIPVGKAKQIVNKLDDIGVATFEIIIPENQVAPQPSIQSEQQNPQEGYQ